MLTRIDSNEHSLRLLTSIGTCSSNPVGFWGYPVPWSQTNGYSQLVLDSYILEYPQEYNYVDKDILYSSYTVDRDILYLRAYYIRYMEQLC